MLKPRAIVAIILLLTCFRLTLAQPENLRFTHLSSANGLPNNMVFSMYQDSTGYMWMGTSNGLVRFDGYNYILYQHNPGDANTLANNQVMQIMPDGEENLWLRMQYQGVNLFNLRTGKITRFNSDQRKKNSLPGNDVRAMFMDHSGAVWINTDRGLCRYDRKTNSFLTYSYDTFLDRLLSTQPPTGESEDCRGRLWFYTRKGVVTIDRSDLRLHRFGSDYRQLRALDTLQVNLTVPDGDLMWIATENEGLFQFNCKTRRLSHFCTTSKRDNLPAKSLRLVFVSRRGDVFITSDDPDNKIYVVDHRYKHHPYFKKYQLPGDVSEITDFAEDKSGDVWISTSEGLFKYQPESRSLKQYLHDPANPFSIHGNHVFKLFINRDDILWASIYKTGVDMLNLNQKPFRGITVNFAHPSEGLPENNIISVMRDRHGNIWAGTMNDGVVRIDLRKDQYTRFPVNGKDPHKLYANGSGALFEDYAGNIWVGSWFNKVDILNPARKKIVRLSEDRNIREWSVRKIVADRSGEIWIASTSRGLIGYNPWRKTFFFPSELYEPDFRSNGIYRTIFVDRKNQVWIGTQNGGLLYFDKRGKRFIHFRNDPSNTQSISSDNVYDIYEDTRGIFWIGTSHGFNAFYPSKKTFTRFYTKDGLCNNSVYSIIPDGQGNLWLGTDDGLSKFNLTHHTFVNYNTDDGLLSDEFNANAACRASNGELFFGTSNGLVHFYPSGIQDDKTFKIPVFTNLKVSGKNINPFDTINGRVILHKEISYASRITLSRSDYFFSLAFSDFNYTNPSRVRFRYKLDGFDKQWILSDDKAHFLTYTNLAPGHYTLRLRATNDLGEWPGKDFERQLEIRVLPPFWQTWFFRIILVLIIAALLVFFYFRNIHHILRGQTDLERLVENRTRELSEANDILAEQKEELLTQSTKLQEVNQVLEAQKEEIKIQNKELYQHRLKLEELVENRTSELFMEKRRAEASDNLKSAFLANMSHEIRTPLNAIVGFSSMLNNPVLSSEEREDFVQIINESCESLLVLIDDILDLSRIEAGQMPLSVETFSAIEALQQVHDMFVQREKKTDVFLHFEGLPGSNPLLIHSDRIRFKQVLTNLISNALKYTDHGSVEVGYKTDGQVVFYVKDTGIGISKRDQESIFERFRKVEDTSRKVYSGTGLGLAISKKLIEMLGGRIWVESEPGKGSVFYFTQPTSRKPDREKDHGHTVKNSRIESNLLSGKTIILVEDEQHNYYFLEKLLSKLGAEIIGFRNGVKVVEYFASGKAANADLVLMDIKMPEMNGYEASGKIKAIMPAIPIIAQTAFAMVEDVKLIKASNFDDYITKPINIDQLKLLLVKYLLK